MRLRTIPAADHTPLPAEFLSWQVALRRHTAEERGGAPHVGVAPLLTVRRPTTALGVATHSIICGIIPAPDRIETKTAEFRALYERFTPDGARATYDAGIDYLCAYYNDPSEFDCGSLTTLLSNDSPAIRSLRAEARCSLLFYVFNLTTQSPLERFRCLQLDCEADVLDSGPIYENVWWHNTLFHGKAEKSVVVRFRHQKTYDTRFGDFQPL